jgi:hypothetical protein
VVSAKRAAQGELQDMRNPNSLIERHRLLLPSLREVIRTTIPALAIAIALVTVVQAAEMSGGQASNSTSVGNQSAAKAIENVPSNAEHSDGDVLLPLTSERLRYAFYSVFFYMTPLTFGVMALIFFLHYGRPDTTKSFLPYFGEGQVMQFVVIIAIAGNIWSLAIAGVIGRTEVAAIYGGIVGYVLGKRSSVGEADSKETMEASQPDKQKDAVPQMGNDD